MFVVHFDMLENWLRKWVKEVDREQNTTEEICRKLSHSFDGFVFGLIQNEFDDNWLVPIFGEHFIRYRFIAFNFKVNDHIIFLLSNVWVWVKFPFRFEIDKHIVKSMSHMVRHLVLVAIKKYLRVALKSRE